MYNLIRAVPTVLRAARSILPTVGQILKNPKTIASLVAPSAIQAAGQTFFGTGNRGGILDFAKNTMANLASSYIPQGARDFVKTASGFLPKAIGTPIANFVDRGDRSQWKSLGDLGQGETVTSLGKTVAEYANKVGFKDKLFGSDLAEQITNFKLPQFLTGQGGSLDSILGTFIKKPSSQPVTVPDMGPRPPPQRIQFPVYDHEGYQSELSQYLPDISGSSRMLMNKMDQGKFNSVRRVRDDGYYMAEEPRMRKQVRTNTFGGGGGGYNMMNNNPGQQFSFLRGSNPNNAFND